MSNINKKLWSRVISQYLGLYQSFFSATSSAGKGHQQEVIAKLKEQQDDFELTFVKEPEEKPVCEYLSQVIRSETNKFTNPLLNSIKKVRDSLTWEYGYIDLPSDLKQKYAYTELLGPDGPILGQELILGLVLLAPGCLYPEHSHEQIAESYVVLSGTVTVNNNQDFSTGDSIYNSPGEKHELATANVPCLLAYTWTGDKEILANNAMEFD